MRVIATIITVLMISFGSVVAGADGQEANIDTLIIEPHQAGDLPGEVVAWLEARDYVIPQPWEEGLPVVPGVTDNNAIAGSLIAAGHKDVAVLIVHREAIIEDFELWVFPARDTLKAEKIGPVDSADYEWLEPWWATFRNEKQLRYAWRIESVSPQYISSFKDRMPKAEELPELTHDGIHINVGDKPYGAFYYYDGTKWIHIHYLG